jgi:hypothetical protein
VNSRLHHRQGNQTSTFFSFKRSTFKPSNVQTLFPFGSGTACDFLCFQSLPTTPICNSFVFRFLQQWVGVWEGALPIFEFRVSSFNQCRFPVFPSRHSSLVYPERFSRGAHSFIPSRFREGSLATLRPLSFQPFTNCTISQPFCFHTHPSLPGGRGIQPLTLFGSTFRRSGILVFAARLLAAHCRLSAPLGVN